jgi:hypothetical protein
MARARTVGWSALALVAVTLAAGPLVGEWIVRGRVLPKLSARLGRPVKASRAWVRWGRVEMRGLTVVGGGSRPTVEVPRVSARLSMGGLLSGRVEISELDVYGPRIAVMQTGAEDNISAIRAHLAEGSPTGSSGGGGSSSKVRIGKTRIHDGAFGLAVDGMGEWRVGAIDGELPWDGDGQIVLKDVVISTGGERGPRAHAEKITVQVSLERGRPRGLPVVEIENGTLTPFRGLDLSGVFGTIKPDPADPERAALELRGSYGGATAELWNATGFVKPRARSGELKLRAARFRLSQVASFLPKEVLNAKAAEVGGKLDVKYEGDRVTLGGGFHLSGLTVAHPMLAPVAVPHLGFDARLKGSFEVSTRHLKLDALAVDYRNVHAVLVADVENFGRKPKLAATFQVKPLPCQLALQAFPPEVTPYLQGFKMNGTFSTDLHVGIDFADLENTPIDLGGKVGIEGCKVLEAPDWSNGKRLLESFQQTVPIEPGRWMTFFAGPENPDWTPYSELSPHLINSIMTTEDNGFFKHKGFIASEFRTALQQNLQRGYFRLGASSITMQMVKNVLLSREKTLSRKLQELYLTWYLEHQLGKERILEIYFNVIELGPGIYGIGRATRHYFGKPPKELTPQEAAWFSSILPAPKRRYVQYCRKDGQVDAKWDAYLKRIMRKNHERGRLTDDEWMAASKLPLQFDRKEATPERECVAMVKKMTTPPGQPVPK